jgi:acetyltransferase-like isoleucine patch superfamily enzyme
MARVFRFLKALLGGQLAGARSRLRNARFAAQAPGVRIHPRALIDVSSPCTLEFGPGVSVGAFTVIIVADDPLSSSEPQSSLRVGAGTYIGELNNIRAVGTTVIGEKCLISQGVSLIGANHDCKPGTFIADQAWRRDKRGIRLGDGVWVGANAVLLPGISIGSGAIVAAGSIVNCDVAPDSIVGGIPARVIGHRMNRPLAHPPSLAADRSLG